MSNISKERIQNAARAIEDYFCASDRMIIADEALTGKDGE